MLTADLVDARVVRGVVRPRWIETDDEERLGLAGTLIDAFEACVGAPVSRLRSELRRLAGTEVDHRFRRALAKLLLDRCEVDTECAIEPSELRARVFERAAAAHLAAGPHGIDADAVLATIAAETALSPEEVRRGLYADLKDEQVVRTFAAPTPSGLLERYNVALAQALLLRASALELDLEPQDAATYRALFRAMKFHRLLYEIEARPKGGYAIRLDGPLSLFAAVQKYGLSMASFLPHVLHCTGFELRAAVAWGPARSTREFRLTAKDGLVPEQRVRGRWRPPEMDWFLEQFAKVESDWLATSEPELLDLGGRGVLVPDYVFAHRATGRLVHFEVFGYWRRGALQSRLDLLKRFAPGDVILGVGRELHAGGEAFEGVPAEVYQFRSVPIAREVRAVLRRFED
jgi:uncharacterized protein